MNAVAGKRTRPRQAIAERGSSPAGRSIARRRLLRWPALQGKVFTGIRNAIGRRPTRRQGSVRCGVPVQIRLPRFDSVAENSCFRHNRCAIIEGCVGDWLGRAPATPAGMERFGLPPIVFSIEAEIAHD